MHADLRQSRVGRGFGQLRSKIWQTCASGPNLGSETHVRGLLSGDQMHIPPSGWLTCDMIARLGESGSIGLHEEKWVDSFLDTQPSVLSKFSHWSKTEAQLFGPIIWLSRVILAIDTIWNKMKFDISLFSFYFWRAHSFANHKSTERRFQARIELCFVTHVLVRTASQRDQSSFECDHTYAIILYSEDGLDAEQTRGKIARDAIRRELAIGIFLVWGPISEMRNVFHSPETI